jgi:hypothetical protein
MHTGCIKMSQSNLQEPRHNSGQLIPIPAHFSLRMSPVCRSIVLRRKLYFRSLSDRPPQRAQSLAQSNPYSCTPHVLRWKHFQVMRPRKSNQQTHRCHVPVAWVLVQPLPVACLLVSTVALLYSPLAFGSLLTRYCRLHGRCAKGPDAGDQASGRALHC